MKNLKLSDGLCILCNGEIESVQHLFFDCVISQQCIVEIKRWLNLKMQTNDVGKQVRWIQRSKCSKFRKEVWSSAIAASLYNIWQQRNMVLWCGEQFNVEQVVQRVKRTVQCRVYTTNCSRGSNSEMAWFLGCTYLV